MTKQKEQKVPKVGNRCPRCHRPAPRMDGVPCKLCCPEGPERLTVTDRKTGVTHWYRSKCKPEVLLSGTAIGELNVGASVPVTCIDCIAREDEQWKTETIKMVEYAKDDAANMLKAVNMLKGTGLC